MFLLGLGVRERGLGGVSGGGPGDACSLSPAWAQTSRRPQLALFQGRAEPWEQTQIRRIWCLFFVPLLLRWKVRKKGITAALIPLWRLYICLRAPREARRATSRRRLSKSISNTFARSAHGSGAGPPSPSAATTSDGTKRRARSLAFSRRTRNSRAGRPRRAVPTAISKPPSVRAGTRPRPPPPRPRAVAAAPRRPRPSLA